MINVIIAIKLIAIIIVDINNNITVIIITVVGIAIDAISAHVNKLVPRAYFRVTLKKFREYDRDQISTRFQFGVRRDGKGGGLRSPE